MSPTPPLRAPPPRVSVGVAAAAVRRHCGSRSRHSPDAADASLWIVRLAKERVSSAQGIKPKRVDVVRVWTLAGPPLS